MESLFSFLLTNEEAFLELNPNLLETNVVNIVLLLALLAYGYQTSLKVNLETRQKQIIQTIENAQKDVLKATNYYYLAEKGFTQSLFWLQSWKTLYEKEKVKIVERKYKRIQEGVLNIFCTTDLSLLQAEQKVFLTLQRYILFLTASRILRKFLFLSKKEKSRLIEVTLSQLGGMKK